MGVGAARGLLVLKHAFAYIYLDGENQILPDFPSQAYLSFLAANLTGEVQMDGRVLVSLPRCHPGRLWADLQLLVAATQVRSNYW